MGTGHTGRRSRDIRQTHLSRQTDRSNRPRDPLHALGLILVVVGCLLVAAGFIVAEPVIQANPWILFQQLGVVPIPHLAYFLLLVGFILVVVGFVVFIWPLIWPDG